MNSVPEKPAAEKGSGKLGMGINTLNGTLKKVILSMASATIYNEPLNDSRLVIKTVDNATALHREISGTAAISTVIGPNVQAGLEFSGSHETKFDALSTYCLIKITTNVNRVSLTGNYDFADIPKALLQRNENAKADSVSSKMIFDRFGNACITSVTYGHEIIFVIQLRKASAQTTNKTSTTLKAEVPDVAKFSGGLSTLLESIDQGDVINVSTYTRGLDEKRLDVDSLEGLKIFLDSFTKFKSTLMHNTVETESVVNKSVSTSSNASKPTDIGNKGADSSSGTVPAVTSLPPLATVTLYHSPPSGDASAKNNAVAAVLARDNEEAKDTASMPPAKEWNAVLSYDTQPFYVITEDASLYEIVRRYDSELLPFKNISAKILECYEKVEVFLQLCDLAEKHLVSSLFSQSKKYRSELKEKKEGLEIFRKQLMQKLLNIYKNPFEQDAVALADGINVIIVLLNTLTCGVLKFNEGLILLKRVTRSTNHPNRSRYIHEFSLPLVVEALHFDAKHEGSEQEITSEFNLKQRNLLRDAKVFTRLSSGSSVELSSESHKILENTPTLYFTDFKPAVTGAYIMEIWGQVLPPFIAITKITEDQLSADAANAPFNDPDRGQAFDKAISQLDSSRFSMWEQVKSDRLQQKIEQLQKRADELLFLENPTQLEEAEREALEKKISSLVEKQAVIVGKQLEYDLQHLDAEWSDSKTSLRQQQLAPHQQQAEGGELQQRLKLLRQ